MVEKAMATHSSVLAWRIPGTGEPHGLPSMGSHRVGHDWSDLAAGGWYWWWFSHSVTSNSLWPTDYSPPGSSVHGILQARTLEWAAFSKKEDRDSKIQPVKSVFVATVFGKMLFVFSCSSQVPLNLSSLFWLIRRASCRNPSIMWDLLSISLLWSLLIGGQVIVLAAAVPLMS